MDDAIEADSSPEQGDKSNEIDTLDYENSNINRHVLTTKAAVMFLLEGKLNSKVCRYCLNVDTSLIELDRIMNVAVRGVIYNVTIRAMIASFYPVKVTENPNFPNKICETCLDQTLGSYLFVLQCESAERSLRNCFDDVFDKTEKLDPLERTKKRGRAKINPNYNKIYTDHENVIDYAEPVINIINTSTELQTKQPETKSNQHECPKCWQIYPTLPALLNHEKIHPNSMWFHCRVCGKSFPKRGQLKKHAAINHSTKQQLENDDLNFKCNECGFNSDNYSSHLEHIEKHKFKKALQSIVVRKTNKMCSVCLDKGNLKDLDQMVCLHGGSPGLTGDVTLYGLLGSLFPNKNKHKYQELHIPRTASIIKMIKKVKSVNESVNMGFKLSSPTVITTKNIKLHNTFTFIFTKPKLNMNEVKEGLNDNDKMQSNNESNNISDCVINYDSKNLNDKEILYKFTNPDFNIDIHTKREERQIDTSVILNSCKKCWIFGNPCKLTKRFDDTPKRILKCNYCWVFKNTKICDICKLENSANHMETKVADSEETTNTQDNKTNEARPKKFTWQCNTCLTNNGFNESKCGCCDSYYNVNSYHYSGFNFPDSKSNKNFVISQVCEISRERSDKNIVDLKYEIESITRADNKCAEDITSVDINIIQNTGDIHMDTTEMEVEPISTISSIDFKYCNNITLNETEMMDTGENDLFTCNKNETSITNLILSTDSKESLQFHIGTGSTNKTRKDIRSLRRIKHR